MKTVSKNSCLVNLAGLMLTLTATGIRAGDIKPLKGKLWNPTLVSSLSIDDIEDPFLLAKIA